MSDSEEERNKREGGMDVNNGGENNSDGGNNSSPREEEEKEESRRGRKEEEKEENEEEENRERRRGGEREGNSANTGEEQENRSHDSGKRCCDGCRAKPGVKRACVCVVPAAARRSQIKPEGCITCKCNGCHPEDIERRRMGLPSPPPNYNNNPPRDSYRNDGDYRGGYNRGGDRGGDRGSYGRYPDRGGRSYPPPRRDDREFDRRDRRDYFDPRGRGDDRAAPRIPPREPVLESDLKNGCCKQCMRAFSQTGRACLCQVPARVRNSVIPEGGCKVCACQGCHPEDRGLISASHTYQRNYDNRPQPVGGRREDYYEPYNRRPYYPADPYHPPSSSYRDGDREKRNRDYPPEEDRNAKRYRD